MLGIDQQIVELLGRLSVAHTWASELFRLDEEKAYIAEENLDEWIRDEVQKDYPELPRFNPVERGLRNTLLLTLENQALEKMYRHPWYQNLNIPLIESAEEALWVAKMEDIGMEGEMEQKFLAIIRTMLPDEEGNQSQRKPDLEKLTVENEHIRQEYDAGAEIQVVDPDPEADAKAREYIVAEEARIAALDVELERLKAEFEDAFNAFIDAGKAK